MEWTQIIDPIRRCPKWIPKAHVDNLAAARDLGAKAMGAERTFRDGKRKREKPAKLKTLKAVVTKAEAAYAKARKTHIANGVYIIHDATGFVVLRRNTGSKRHSKHPDLEAAQAAAEVLLG